MTTTSTITARIGTTPSATRTYRGTSVEGMARLHFGADVTVRPGRKGVFAVVATFAPGVEGVVGRISHVRPA